MTFPDSTDIKRLIREYYEQLYTHKFDNLYEMRKFLERQTTNAYTRRNNLKSPLSIKVVKKLPSEKTPDPDGSTDEFYPTFKEK